MGSGGGKGGSDSEDGESRRRKRKDMTSEEKNQARAAKYVTQLMCNFTNYCKVDRIYFEKIHIFIKYLSTFYSIQ